MAKGGNSNKKSNTDFFPVHTCPGGSEGASKKDLLPITKKGGRKPSSVKPTL